MPNEPNDRVVAIQEFMDLLDGTVVNLRVIWKHTPSEEVRKQAGVIGKYLAKAAKAFADRMHPVLSDEWVKPAAGGKGFDYANHDPAQDPL